MSSKTFNINLTATYFYYQGRNKMGFYTGVFSNLCVVVFILKVVQDFRIVNK